VVIQFLASLVSACASEQKQTYPFKHIRVLWRAQTMREPDVANLLLIWDLCVKLINSLAPAADGTERRRACHENWSRFELRVRGRQVWQIYVAPLLYDFNFQGSLRGRDVVKIGLAEEIRPQTKICRSAGSSEN
jgi:hypothetical protein